MFRRFLMDKKTVLDAFMFRHACKEFDPDAKIPEEDFLFILEAARLSPSSFGFEPWKFLVVQDMTLREKLLPHTWGGRGQIPTASHFLVCLAMKTPLLRHDSSRIADFMRRVQNLPEDAIAARMEYFANFQKTDFHLLDNDRAMFDWACKQCYIAQANMMTAAALIGIDSCPIEGFVREKVDEVLAADFGMNPEEYGVAYMLAFGYRIKQPRSKTRQALNDILQWF